MSVSEIWLKKINEDFRSVGMEPQRRPWEALNQYAAQHKVSVPMSSEIAKSIFNWFEKASKPGAHHVGSLFETIYFFDAAFWSLNIPITYGSVSLNSLNCLPDMPELIKADLFSTPQTAWDYTIYWAESVDYSFGLDDLRKNPTLDSFGMELIGAADQELRTSIAQLKLTRPDSRSILSSRMAVEIYLKSFIALKVGMTKKQAKALGHDLQKSFDLFLEVSGHYSLAPLKERLCVYPEMHERYSEQVLTLDALWQGFALAQTLGSLVVREHTDRNTLQQVLPPEYLKRLESQALD